jgi:hypothetical protein
MGKYFLRLLIVFNVVYLHAMHQNPQNVALADKLQSGFDWVGREYFTLDTFEDLKKQGPLKLAVVTTEDSAKQKVKTFYSAPEFAKYALISENRLTNPANRQDILNLALVGYSEKDNKFSGQKDYDLSNLFDFVYETLPCNDDDLTNQVSLHFAQECLEAAKKAEVDTIKNSIRRKAFLVLQSMQFKKTYNPIEEQDLYALLAELRLDNVPTEFQKFNAVEKYAQQILDLQPKISKYLEECRETDKTGVTRHVFNADEPTNFAHVLLGEIYAVGGHGVNQDKPKAYAYLQKVIKNAYSTQYLHNQALLAQANLLRGDISNVPVSWPMRFKLVRDYTIESDLYKVLENNPNAEQKAGAERMLNQMFKE